MAKAKKRGPQPGSGAYPHTMQMRVNDAFLKVLDEWRKVQDGFPSRTEAVRYLVETHPEIRRRATK
jgi:hypothetical protein